ncbi:hypothetical protein [Streptomyces sp. NPDC006333]|uniref:hypothetical protein n=1 Tax=Streptomyces sp. NPDC006333 TaxID=3156753 RepID=UPI0033A4B3AA
MNSSDTRHPHHLNAGAHGWADCTLEDHAKAELSASYITSAAEEFLTAVARLVAGETETRDQFEAEPTA